MKHGTPESARPEEAPILGSDVVVDRLLARPAQQQFPRDALGRHIARLLALHADVAVKFRAADLDAMDEPTKRQLLEDINEVLGVEPIDFSSP